MLSFKGSGGHRRILENGNLIIKSVSRDDEGVYTCTASNELGIDESKGRLIVLRKFTNVRDRVYNFSLQGDHALLKI